MAAGITELRAAVKATLEAEFAAEGLRVLDDKLHDSMGSDGNIAAVYPEGERPHSSGIVEMALVAVQVFMHWDPQIDPAQIVDPALIEDWAWRLQRRIMPESSVNGANLSYYVVQGIIYPDDPTGNKSRFVMDITGYGANASVVESVA